MDGEANYDYASEPKSTRHSEVLQATKELKVSKASSPNGFPNMVQTHFPMRAITFLMKMFDGGLRSEEFPPPWNTLAWYPY
jgi:hypothetical protein